MSTLAHPANPHHAEDPDVVGDRQKLGVILLIVGDVAFLLSLVFTYLYLRGLNTEGAWIPSDFTWPVASAGFGWVIAAVVALSWVSYRWAQSEPADDARLTLGLLIATLLLVVDLVLQVAQMVSVGFRVDDGAYASSWMALSGYHAFHLLLTLFIGIGVWNRARLGKFATNRWHVRLVGYWWTWVVVSAVITATTTSFTAAGQHLGT
ncbi:MAG: cytochrome c oxidase subunit 3 [Actinomycetota bacterium]|nr:cytochrome c oxidase subunit 3 [Actinomycetota bacterium]